MPLDRPRRPAPVLALTIFLGSCGVADRFPPDRDACDRALRDPEAVDALEWLKTPPGPNQLGALSTDDGLALVAKLDMRGADRIVVVEPRKRSGEAGQVCKGLAFRLPSDASRRLAVFKLYALQVRAEGYTPRADTGQDCLYIAFD
jgi:hypothetical protein